jgi:hypothetical protein
MKNQYSFESRPHGSRAAIAIGFSILFLLLGSINNSLFAQASTGTARGVATFECIGITWSGSGGSATTVCNVKYRVAGSGAAWKNGHPLWFDSRAAGNGSPAARPANEYRGSLVNLEPGTTYEIELSLSSGTTNTFTCATWSENFPVRATTTVATRSTTLNITTSGTASGYELYTPAAAASATIDVNNGADNCIYINAAYVIVRGLTLKGARADAIKLGPNAHDVVIENNDISGWGRPVTGGWGMDGDAGVRVANATSVERIIIQRNKIHHPRNTSNNWEQNNAYYNTNHPAGPQGITFETAGGNHVIRYNEIYSDATHYFNDGIGGAENFSYEGFPRANSDIYGNKISQTWDDGIEAEGGNMNVRIWGNFLDSTFVKIAIASTSIGPVYIFRNVTNVSRRSAANDAGTVDNEDRGPFIKAGTSYSQVNGGRIYVFHNTILQPVVAGYNYPLGCGGGIMDWGGGPMTNVESRNNILHIHKSNWQSIGDNYSSQTDNNFDYDLYNALVTSSGGQEQHGWKGTPVYSSGSIAAGWPLAASSKGFDVGEKLNNFSDNYNGAGPDAGAYEAGASPLEFGVNAYLTTPPPPPPTNQPPVANAGNNITVALPIVIATLDGSASTDADGTITNYAWSRVSGPLTISLTSPSAVTTTVTGLLPGTYVFRLTVTDDDGATATDDVTLVVNPLIPLPNQLPVANAGNNITITLPVNTVTLNGSATDADGTVSIYAWTRVSGPNANAFTNGNAASTAATGLAQGTYVFRLTVTDNAGGIATDDVTVTVNAAPPPPNQPPVPNAGNNITITLPVSTATLNGSGSSDADGTITNYTWTWISGPAPYAFANAAASSTAVNNLVQGTYVFRLTIRDDDGATATDDVTVTVNAATPPPNRAPIANAGNNITITLPVNSITLNGSGSSDADGTITTYTWSWISGPASYAFSNATAVSTTVNDLVQGVYTFRLTVRDDDGATATDDVTVTVNVAPLPPNLPPVSNAGNNITITLPINSATLNGSGSTDPDGTIASYAWSRVTGPADFAFSDANAVTTTVSGLVQGTYVFRLAVWDDDGAVTTDDIHVFVNPAPPVPNLPPAANAGNNITITLPVSSTTLNGSGSTDADGTITNYTWTWISGPASYTFANAAAASTGLSNLVQGTYVFRLTVRDDDGATSTDDVTVTVNAAPPPPNQAPVSNAGNNISITLPTNSTTLNGNGSTDADGTITNYTWSWISGPTSYTLANATSVSTALSNLVQGTYIFRLTIRDDDGATAVDDITVIVNPAPPAANQPPIANAGIDITITLPINATVLNGTASSDPDGNIISYRWSRVMGPISYAFGNATTSATVVNILVQGTYVFRLTVTDNSGNTDTDDVHVFVKPATVPPPAVNQPPVANAGTDIILYLPQNSTTVNGGYSTDPDGLISTYEWKQLNGPSQAAMTDKANPSVDLSDLMMGEYEFELKVMDSHGASAKDTVKVTVKNRNGDNLFCNVFPNPASGIVNIQYISNNTGNVLITIYDANNRYVYRAKVMKDHATLFQTFDVSRFSSGTYFIEIEISGSKKLVRKFVKTQF